MAKKQNPDASWGQRGGIALLEDAGWVKGKPGNHQVKMTKAGCRPITLPHHRGEDYPIGLRRAILKQAGLLTGGLEADDDPRAG